MSKKGRNGFRINVSAANSVDEFVRLLLDHYEHRREVDFIVDAAAVWLAQDRCLRDFILAVADRMEGNMVLFAAHHRVENRLPVRRLNGSNGDYFDPAVFNIRNLTAEIFFREFVRFRDNVEIRRHIVGRAADWAGDNIGRLIFFTQVPGRIRKESSPVSRV